jgi:transposase
VNFVEWLREKQPETRSILVWDNAIYHTKGAFRDYLGEQNKGLSAKDWAITCLNFAPYAPQENPVEDIWLQRRGVAPPQKLVKKTLLSIRNV